MRVQVCVPVTRKVLETPHHTHRVQTSRNAMTCRATACGSLEERAVADDGVVGVRVDIGAWRPVEVEAHRPKLGSDGRRGLTSQRRVVDVPQDAHGRPRCLTHTEHTTAFLIDTQQRRRVVRHQAGELSVELQHLGRFFDVAGKEDESGRWSLPNKGLELIAGRGALEAQDEPLCGCPLSLSQRVCSPTAGRVIADQHTAAGLGVMKATRVPCAPGLGASERKRQLLLQPSHVRLDVVRLKGDADRRRASRGRRGAFRGRMDGSIFVPSMGKNASRSIRGTSSRPRVQSPGRRRSARSPPPCPEQQWRCGLDGESWTLT